MDEFFISQQSTKERALGLWQPERFAWKLANVRAIKHQLRPLAYARGRAGDEDNKDR